MTVSNQLRLKALAVFAGMAISSMGFAVKSGDLFDKLTFQGINNPDVAPDQLKGKVTIINFWATWCEACKIEIKEMEKEFSELFKNPKFNMMFVSVDKEPAASLEWIQKNTINGATLAKYLYKDPDFKAADSLELQSFPYTVVIGPDLKVLNGQDGYAEGAGSTAAMAKIAADAIGAIK